MTNDKLIMGCMMSIQGLMQAKVDVESVVRQMREAHVRGESLSVEQLRIIAARCQDSIDSIRGTG